MNIIWAPGVSIDEVERDLILNALKLYQGNRTKAAEAVGISIRTMTNKITKYKEQGIKIPGGTSFVAQPADISLGEK